MRALAATAPIFEAQYAAAYTPAVSADPAVAVAPVAYAAAAPAIAALHAAAHPSPLFSSTSWLYRPQLIISSRTSQYYIGASKKNDIFTHYYTKGPIN